MDTLFWHDKWIGANNLASDFLSLYKLDKKKNCFVLRLGFNLIIWAWKRAPSTQLETTEFFAFKNCLESATISYRFDTWRSNLSSNGKFYVRDLRRLIDSRLTTSMNNSTDWIKLVPLKIICFTWCAASIAFHLRLRFLVEVSEFMLLPVIVVTRCWMK